MVMRVCLNVVVKVLSKGAPYESEMIETYQMVRSLDSYPTLVNRYNNHQYLLDASKCQSINLILC